MKDVSHDDADDNDDDDGDADEDNGGAGGNEADDEQAQASYWKPGVGTTCLVHEHVHRVSLSRMLGEALRSSTSFAVIG